MSDTAIREEERLQADDLARRGIRALAGGDRTEALHLLGEAVARSPEHAVANLHLGMVLSEEGRPDEARPAIERAVALRPDSAAFRLFAGRAYFDAGDCDAARRELERASALSPRNDLVAGYRALVDWAAGDPSAAERLKPDALPDANHFLARLLMLIETDLRGHAEDFVREDLVPPLLDRLRILFELWMASRETKRADFDRAAMRAQFILEIQPGHPAGAALARECREGALDVSRRRVAESPDNVEPRMDLANRLAEAEDFREADAEMAEAARLLGEAAGETMEKDPAVLRLRGRIAYGMGRIDEAAERIEAGAEPGFAMAEVEYYRGLCAIASGRQADGLRAFRNLVAKVCWAVPMRLREYLSRRRAQQTESAIRTSP